MTPGRNALAALLVGLIHGCVAPPVPERLEGAWDREAGPIGVAVRSEYVGGGEVIGGIGDWLVFDIWVDLVPEGEGEPLRELPGSLSYCDGACEIDCGATNNDFCGTLEGRFEEGFTDASVFHGQPYWHLQGELDKSEGFVGVGWYSPSVGGGQTFDLVLAEPE